MKKEFIPYEPALALKELGFDEYCLMGYSINKTLDYFPENKNGKNSEYKIVVCAPLYQQSFKWFREKHKLLSYITCTKKDDYEWVIPNIYNIPFAQPYFLTYEKAELACLNKLIEIVKQKK